MMQTNHETLSHVQLLTDYQKISLGQQSTSERINSCPLAMPKSTFSSTAGCACFSLPNQDDPQSLFHSWLGEDFHKCVPKFGVREQRSNSQPPASHERSVEGKEDEEDVLKIDMTDYINPEIHRDHPFLLEKYAETNPNETAASLNANVQVKKDHLYKTVMCQAWLELKDCEFGENCKFAHGQNELQPLSPKSRLNSKYKTRICDNYTNSGICPFGVRCLFIHIRNKLLQNNAILLEKNHVDDKKSRLHPTRLILTNSNAYENRQPGNQKKVPIINKSCIDLMRTQQLFAQKAINAPQYFLSSFQNFLAFQQHLVRLQQVSSSAEYGNKVGQFLQRSNVLVDQHQQQQEQQKASKNSMPLIMVPGDKGTANKRDAANSRPSAEWSQFGNCLNNKKAKNLLAPTTEFHDCPNKVYHFCEKSKCPNNSANMGPFSPEFYERTNRNLAMKDDMLFSAPEHAYNQGVCEARNFHMLGMGGCYESERIGGISMPRRSSVNVMNSINLVDENSNFLMPRNNSANCLDSHNNKHQFMGIPYDTHVVERQFLSDTDVSSSLSDGFHVPTKLTISPFMQSHQDRSKYLELPKSTGVSPLSSPNSFGDHSEHSQFYDNLMEIWSRSDREECSRRNDGDSAFNTMLPNANISSRQNDPIEDYYQADGDVETEHDDFEELSQLCQKSLRMQNNSSHEILCDSYWDRRNFKQISGLI